MNSQLGQSISVDVIQSKTGSTFNNNSENVNVKSSISVKQGAILDNEAVVMKSIPPIQLHNSNVFSKFYLGNVNNPFARLAQMLFCLD